VHRLPGGAAGLCRLANLERSRLGRDFRAVRDDEVASELAGLYVARVQVLAFVVSAACAGLAGGLLVVVTSLAAPGAFPLALSVALLTGVILGGLGSLAGAVWGAAALTLDPDLGRRRQRRARPVDERAGQPRARGLRGRADRRDAGRAAGHPGRAARAHATNQEEHAMRFV
jgi:ABC-type branched-subunit amino acid transport system permease subunit